MDNSNIYKKVETFLAWSLIEWQQGRPVKSAEEKM